MTRDADAALASVTCLLIDMDGVLFRGHTPLPEASTFLNWLPDRGIRFKLLTNNSSLTPARNAAKLAAMGILVDTTAIYTSSLATSAYLKDQGAAGQRAYVIGEEGLRTALEDAGMDLRDDAEDVRWVVAGLDRHLTYRKLMLAGLAIQGGATFVATNSDTSLPIESGLAPGAGAIQAAITVTTGMVPVVIGKPEPGMLESAAVSLWGDRSNTAMLGDRLDTDILAAARAGMRSILVETGVSRASDLPSAPAQPSLVVDDLAHLMRVWSELL